MDFTITAHIEFKTKAGTISTRTIRLVVPADNGLEAREKAREFIQRQTAVVIDSCDYKPQEKAKSWLDEADQTFKDIFKNWPHKG
jgi:hypothetical protein